MDGCTVARTLDIGAPDGEVLEIEDLRFAESAAGDASSNRTIERAILKFEWNTVGRNRPWWHGSDDRFVVSTAEGGWALCTVIANPYSITVLARSEGNTEAESPSAVDFGDPFGQCTRYGMSPESMWACYWIQMAYRTFQSWHPTTLLGLAHELRIGRPPESHEAYGVWRVIYKVLLGIPNSGKTNMVILLEKLF